ncbi:MAG: trehalase family glycosidase [Pseudomonadota bacterium]
MTFAITPTNTQFIITGDMNNNKSLVITLNKALAPILSSCLKPALDQHQQSMSQYQFERDCVIPYINGAWLDKKMFLRTNAMLAQAAEDKLIKHPKGQAFPIFYPAVLRPLLEKSLTRKVKQSSANVIVKPLPSPLPKPSLSPNSLYNNIGLLYLPNAYVVPGDMFNEMYGWDSFFIVKGLLASANYILTRPHSVVWSASDKQLVHLSDNNKSPYYYYAYVEKLFQIAKGMVDNHIFEIDFYGGFILNANRTYYLTRSQPPLFTEEALAVYHFATRDNMPYDETLAPFLKQINNKFTQPVDYKTWLKQEVLPAGIRYYRFWTDPTDTIFAEKSNPRVVTTRDAAGKSFTVYRFYTDGVGPAPEVARSTQPQNVALYQQAGEYFAKHPQQNLDNWFYNPKHRCKGLQVHQNCGDAQFGLTQHFYASDRAIRESGFDLSSRFGKVGQLATAYAPISLNVLIYQMGNELNTIASITNSTPPVKTTVLQQQKETINHFFVNAKGQYSDRLVIKLPIKSSPSTYLYATNFYPLWSSALTTASMTNTMIHAGLEQHHVGDRDTSLLPNGKQAQFGIPTSLTSSLMQWDYPYAWAPIQYFIGQGLKNQHRPQLAYRVMQDWLNAGDVFFSQTGDFIEKYVSYDALADKRIKYGYAQAQKGFGWTNAVYMQFYNQLYG